MPKLKPYTSVVTTNSMKTTDAAEKYRRLREKIVASGIPLLTDSELRREIRARKGTMRTTKN